MPIPSRPISHWVPCTGGAARSSAPSASIRTCWHANPWRPNTASRRCSPWRRTICGAGLLDRAEGLFQQVSEVPRLRASALDALRLVYERQHDWQQALGAFRQLERIKAAAPPKVAAHYLCELAALALERGDPKGARQLLREAGSQVSPFPRAALLGAQIAQIEAQPQLAVRLLRQALTEAPELLQEELPHLLELVGPDARDAVLAELVTQAGSRNIGELKRLVFAAIAAGLADAPPLGAPIEKVFSQDATLKAVWRADPAQDARMVHEIGALLGERREIPLHRMRIFRPQLLLALPCLSFLGQFRGICHCQASVNTGAAERRRVRIVRRRTMEKSVIISPCHPNQ